MTNDETKQNFLKEVFLGLDISLSGQKTRAFLRYFELLEEKNKVMNRNHGI